MLLFCQLQCCQRWLLYTISGKLGSRVYQHVLKKILYLRPGYWISWIVIIIVFRQFHSARMPSTHANIVRGANPASDDCSRVKKRLGWCHVTLIVYCHQRYLEVVWTESMTTLKMLFLTAEKFKISPRWPGPINFPIYQFPNQPFLDLIFGEEELRRLKIRPENN